ENLGKAAQACEDHRLFPFGKPAESLGKGCLKQVRCARGHPFALVRAGQEYPALVLVSTLSPYQVGGLETIDDVGDRRLTELQRSREVGRRDRPALLDLLQDE